MKSYTDIEQSKKLAEILPLESADMWYQHIGYSIVNGTEKLRYFPMVIRDCVSDEDIPCWSLSALLRLMPPYLFEFERGIDLNIYPNLNGKGWHCSYMPNNIESLKKDKFRQITNGDNPIDAAFEMVCWLKENNEI